MECSDRFNNLCKVLGSICNLWNTDDEARFALLYTADKVKLCLRSNKTALAWCIFKMKGFLVVLIGKFTLCHFMESKKGAAHRIYISWSSGEAFVRWRMYWRIDCELAWRSYNIINDFWRFLKGKGLVNCILIVWNAVIREGNQAWFVWDNMLIVPLLVSGRFALYKLPVKDLSPSNIFYVWRNECRCESYPKVILLYFENIYYF